MFIMAVVNDKCNLNCDYCFQFYRTHKQTIKVEYIKTLIDLIYGDTNPLGLSLQNIPELRFCGGEPFIDIDIISEATDYFVQKVKECPFADETKLSLNIVTNGVLLNTPKVREYCEKYKSILGVCVSIDGIKEIHDKHRVDLAGNGSFDRIYKNLKEFDIDVKSLTVPCVLCNDVIDKLYDALEFWTHEDINFGVRLVHGNAHELPSNEVLKEQFRKIVDWYTCQSVEWILQHRLTIIGEPGIEYTSQFMAVLKHVQVCGHLVAINPDGRIGQCMHKLPYACNSEKYLLGSVLEPETIDWETLKTKVYYGDFDIYKEKNRECYRCPIGVFCGKCPVWNLTSTGDEADWVKDCNVRAFHHMLTTFTINFWLSIYNKYNTSKKIKSVPAENVLICKDWALEVMDEDIYKLICDVTREVGGNVTTLTTKLYSEEQLAYFEEQAKELKATSVTVDKEEFKVV